MLWILAEIVRRDEERQPQTHQDSFGFAANDLVKSMLSLSIWFICRHFQGVYSLSTIVRTVAFCGSPETHPGLPTCNVPSHAHGQGFPISRSCSDCRETMSSRHPRSSTVNLTLGSVQSTLSIFVVGLVYTLRAYTVCVQTLLLFYGCIYRECSHRILGLESLSTLLLCISLSL